MTFLTRIVQPIHWTGTTKRHDGVMTCGVCTTPDECADADRCARASDEDYDHARRILGDDEA